MYERHVIIYVRFFRPTVFAAVPRLLNAIHDKVSDVLVDAMFCINDSFSGLSMYIYD